MVSDKVVEALERVVRIARAYLDDERLRMHLIAAFEDLDELEGKK